MNLKEKVKNLPSSPGVYLMKDSLNSVIYVGKSKNLKNRVGSYFQNSKSHTPKVVKLVKNLKDFEYILTDTEFEAFMLECTLIKEIKPAYNRLMKSPKSYSYIKIKLDANNPDIEVSNEANKDDRNLYFGPYANRNTVLRGIQGIRESCKILCNGNSRKASSCLNYSLGLCIGLCLDGTAKKYSSVIFDKIIKLLEGTDKSIITEMENKMLNASENFDFEIAAKYRDYISAVNYLLNSAVVMDFTKENKNIALLEYLSDDTIKFFLIRGNKVLFSEKYNLNQFHYEELKAIFKTNILSCFNDKVLKSPIDIGKDELDESQIIYTYLKSKSSSCKHAVIAEKWISTTNNKNIDKALDKLLINTSSTRIPQ